MYREILLSKRTSLQSLYEHDVKAGKASSDDNSDDFGDRANNSFNRELMFALSETEGGILLQIEEAMQRLEGGTYGYCEQCPEAIPPVRLKAIPWARYCISCQEKQELGLLDG
jgi:DnaK suppressor protein